MQRRLETPQRLHESIDVVAVVVGVEGDPEPARSTAADDPGLGSETFRGHHRIVIGVPQGHDVGRRRWIAQRPERAPSQLGDPIDGVRRQTPLLALDMEFVVGSRSCSLRPTSRRPALGYALGRLSRRRWRSTARPLVLRSATRSGRCDGKGMTRRARRARRRRSPFARVNASPHDRGCTAPPSSDSRASARPRS